jgi:hypothetical protein
VKQISMFVLGLAAVFASAPAPAQDLTAGKTPAQLFRSDCAECHHSPSGLARSRDGRMLATFLREHYTTKPDTAGELAAYLSGFAVTAPNRGAGVGLPATGDRRQLERRNRVESEATANGDGARPNAKPIEDPAGRPRPTTGQSGDGEKQRARTDGDVPRPPGSIVTMPAGSKSNVRTLNSEPREAIDPISRLRSSLSSGLGSESAAKTGTPKARKRRNRADSPEPPAPDVQATVKPATDAPAIPAPSGTNDAIAPGVKPDATGSATVPAAATSPSSEQ